jgi:hypothetical protein
MVKMTPVQSSNLSAIGYDDDKKEMHVQFKNGQTYVYAGVEPHHHRGLVGAESVGRHFAQHVTGKFAHRKI